MGSRLENAIWEITHFTPYQSDLQKRLNAVLEEVTTANKDNFEALLQIRQMDEETLDISDYKYISDYEIMTKTYRNSEGDEFTDEDNYREWLEKKYQNGEKKFHYRRMWSVVEEDGDVYEYDSEIMAEANCNENHGDRTEERYFVIEFDEEGTEVDIHDSHVDEIDAETSARERWEDWFEEEASKFDDFEYDYDEIYWNTVYNYNGRVDVAIAQRLGLGVLQMNESEDEYMFLQGCGMDLSPKFVAYQVLAHGGVMREYTDKLRPSNWEYFEYVVGRDVFRDVFKKMELERFLPTEIEDVYNEESDFIKDVQWHIQDNPGGTPQSIAEKVLGSNTVSKRVIRAIEKEIDKAGVENAL